MIMINLTVDEKRIIWKSLEAKQIPDGICIQSFYP